MYLLVLEVFIEKRNSPRRPVSGNIEKDEKTKKKRCVEIKQPYNLRKTYKHVFLCRFRFAIRHAFTLWRVYAIITNMLYV